MRDRISAGMAAFVVLACVGCDQVTSTDGGSHSGGGHSTGGAGAAGGGSAAGGGGGPGDGGAQGGGGGHADAGSGPAAQFVLSVSPNPAVVGRGGLTTIGITITRAGEAGRIIFRFTDAPPGVNGAFTPASTLADHTRLLLTVTATAALGATTMAIHGTAPNGTEAVATVRLTVTAATSVLLVDADGSDNNLGRANPVESPSDALFNSLLAASPHDFFFVAKDANGFGAGPTLNELKPYRLIIWYCGASSQGFTTTDETALAAFLDQGERKLVLFGADYLSATDATWTGTTNQFLLLSLRLIGGYRASTSGPITATGLNTMEPFTLEVAHDQPMASPTSALHPASNAEILFSAPLGSDGGSPFPIALATAAKSIGLAGTSKALLFGFALENATDSGDTTKAAVFARALAY